jgi:hypothetical protein
MFSCIYADINIAPRILVSSWHSKQPGGWLPLLRSKAQGYHQSMSHLILTKPVQSNAMSWLYVAIHVSISQLTYFNGLHHVLNSPIAGMTLQTPRTCGVTFLSRYIEQWFMQNDRHSKDVVHRKT